MQGQLTQDGPVVCCLPHTNAAFLLAKGHVQGPGHGICLMSQHPARLPTMCVHGSRRDRNYWVSVMVPVWPSAGSRLSVPLVHGWMTGMEARVLYNWWPLRHIAGLEAKLQQLMTDAWISLHPCEVDCSSLSMKVPLRCAGLAHAIAGPNAPSLLPGLSVLFRHEPG